MPSATTTPLAVLIQEKPVLQAMAQGVPVYWQNPLRGSVADALGNNPFTGAEVQDAAERLARFAPYLVKVFPETSVTGGIIESPVRPAPAMQQRLAALWGVPFSGRLLLKMDSHLPVSGSIKARGGFYEVLALAESLALAHGLLREGDDYAVLARPEAKEFFGGYSLAVGSTGNLGLSVGLMGATLGFKATVHMSSEARQWKKDLLRSRGVAVVEYAADYSKAVAAGREAAARDPRCHFVDDENSRNLFLGYAVAGLRLGQQLLELGVTVNPQNPLAVYLPCGVGGGPGGVTFGLKLAFGEAVSCFFAEPTHAPAVILGLASGLDGDICAEDLGLDGRTAADGLAVSRPSALVCQAMRHLLDGGFTVPDEELFVLLHLLAETEGVRLEPSALAGLPGVRRALLGELAHAGTPPEATHLVWATGGSLVPPAEWAAYNEQGIAYLATAAANSKF